MAMGEKLYYVLINEKNNNINYIMFYVEFRHSSNIKVIVSAI
jgi:hypothetical protein